MQLPTELEIETLHKKFAPSNDMFDWVYTHCQAVWSIAEQLIEHGNLMVDKDLVKIGCLVHDIGVYTLFDDVDALKPGEKYITHGIHGEEILQAEGYSKTIQRFASHHTGVGLTKEEIENKNLPLPHKDYFAETPEERLVMYADKFHSKTNPPCFNSYEWYKQRAAEFGSENAAKFNTLATEFGVPELAPLAQKYGQTIRGQIER